MMDKQKKPSIRFSGFTDAWEQRKLGELLNLLKDGTHGTHKDVDEGVYLLSAKNIKNGTVNIDDSDRKISMEDCQKIHSTFTLKSGDILITIVGTIGEVALLKSAENLTFQRSVAFLRPMDELFNLFLLSEIKTKNFQVELENRKSVSAQPGIYLGELSKIPISYPKNLEAQHKIGVYFECLDNLTILHQRKYDKLQNVKKSMLEKMFPKDGADVPEIRFKGFTSAWKQGKLSDYLITSSEKNFENIYSKQDVLSVSGNFGIVNQIEFQGRSFAGVSVSNYGIVNTGDVVYTKSPLSSNPYGIIKTNKGKTGIVSTLYAVYHPTEKADSNFVQVYFEQNARVNNYLHPLVNKGAKNDMKVTADNALKGLAMFPKYEEQKQISALFEALDNLITFHQRELEKLQNLKEALLEKMFV